MFPYGGAGNYHKAVDLSVAKACAECIAMHKGTCPYRRMSQTLCSSRTPSGGKQKLSEALTSGAGRSVHCSVHKTLAARELLLKMCAHQRGFVELCVPGKGSSVQGQIRRPEERNFKPLWAIIDSRSKTRTETPTVFLVEMFKVRG